MYETFEHTADLGLRVRAPDLNTLFAEAGRGFFAILVENLDEVRTVQTVEFEVSGEDRVYLFFDWLNELLYQFDTGGLLLSRFEVTLDEHGLKATARGEPVDVDRHRLIHEVKAITYHRLIVEQDNDGWIAEVIVDI